MGGGGGGGGVVISQMDVEEGGRGWVARRVAAAGRQQSRQFTLAVHTSRSRTNCRLALSGEYVGPHYSKCLESTTMDAARCALLIEIKWEHSSLSFYGYCFRCCCCCFNNDNSRNNNHKGTKSKINED